MCSVSTLLVSRATTATGIRRSCTRSDFACIQGERQNAARGELGLPVPASLTHDAAGAIVLNPDDQVQARLQLVFTTRANGAEFSAITQRLRVRLDSRRPSRANSWRAARTPTLTVLDRIATPLSMIIADPKVKDVVVTRQALRLYYQASEGKRGEHPLLRQSAFPDGAMDPARVLAIVDQLLGLDAALRPEGSAHCHRL